MAMSEVTNTIQQLSNQVELLMQRHSQAMGKVNDLNQEVAALQNALAAKDAEIAGLSEKNKSVKLARSLAGEGEGGERSTELKLKINELLREVDKCMALLNK